MKQFIILLSLLVPWTTLLAEPAATLWTGKCVNRTVGARGQVKLILFEPGKPDEAGAKTVSGYLSVTGPLNGGGPFEGKINKGDLTFTTTHLSPIRWHAKFGLDSMVGSYSIPAQGDNPAQAGEFDVDKVPRSGAADEFRQNLMVVIESDYNGIVKGEDGKEHFTPEVVFDALHPVGTGISVQVNDLDLEWQEGAKKTSVEGLRRYTTSLTLYWSSPLTKDGFTRLRTVHNAELGEMISCDMIETNGTTTSEAKETAKEVGIAAGLAVGAALLKSLLESE